VRRANKKTLEAFGFEGSCVGSKKPVDEPSTAGAKAPKATTAKGSFRSSSLDTRQKNADCDSICLPSSASS
jgi:hypothetical protein